MCTSEDVFIKFIASCKKNKEKHQCVTSAIYRILKMIYYFVDISGLVYRYCFEQDKFEGIKGKIRSRKSNDRQYNGQEEKKTNGQTMIYKTLHRK